MTLYWLLEGREPVAVDDVIVWAEWFERAERHVAQTRFDNDGTEILVSTVFLGIDHGFGADGPPVLYETMIFWPNHDLDEWMDRYVTWTQAEAGHLVACAHVERELA